MLPIIELLIDELNDKPGVFAISLVDEPAIESNFIALNAHKVEMKVADEEKRLLVGLALVPDKNIRRVSKNGDEYEIFFSKDTVRKASQLYMSRLRANNTTHQHNKPVDGVSVVETWIVDSPDMDKTKLYGIDAKEGDWAIAMKVENDDVWADAKEGNIMGFSIEGMFAEKPVDKYKDMWDAIENILKTN